MNIKLPIGYDDFSTIRTDHFYYIDKTKFIKELLDKQFQINLITRPRRFGKSLTMSMMEDFFDISRDSKSDFDGLQISREPELCSTWMNQWPVVFITFKDVDGLDFADAYGMLKSVLANVCQKYAFLEKSEKTALIDKEAFAALHYQNADIVTVKNSLLMLTRMMTAHYGKPAILLIDEYDVPIAKASENGYYAEMLNVIRMMISTSLKSNPYLKFAILTGCLKLAKESIFTGTNNFVSDTITSERYDEYIGFTKGEVKQLLADTGFSDHEEEVRKWYNGYRFGSMEIYCPWDVLNHVSALQDNPLTLPQNYWGSTSHNSVIYRFISRDDLNVNEKFELLLGGGTLVESITEDLSYDTLHSTEKNLWSLLFMTGYLTRAELPDGYHVLYPDEVPLRIPNEELKTIFQKNIVDWFQESVRSSDRNELFEAFWNGDVEKAAEEVSNLLFDTISYHDYLESYYHAFVAGLFAGAGYIVESNYERGKGRPDIVIKDNKKRRALVMEIKHTKKDNELRAKCEEAAAQVIQKKYSWGLEKGYRTVLSYGIAFCEKECLIKRAE